MNMRPCSCSVWKRQSGSSAATNDRVPHPAVFAGISGKPALSNAHIHTQCMNAAATICLKMVSIQEPVRIWRRFNMHEGQGRHVATALMNVRGNMRMCGCSNGQYK